MRRANAWVSLAIVALLLVHAIAGGYQLAGVIPGGNATLTGLAYVLVALVAVHVVLGTILTVRSLRTSGSGTRYARENAGFIVRRVSGFLILVFLVAHVLVFSGSTSSGSYRLNLFEGPQLALSIGLVASIAVHLVCNVRPLFLSLGLDQRERRRDVAIVLGAVLAFAAAMFVVYYLRWNVDWQWNIQLGGR